jgi:hypothetical protein
MIRMPITLADLQGARYKSSLAKFKKHSSSCSGAKKLTALREAFAKALGYGTEAELRFLAKKLGDCYMDAPLPIAHAIASVSQRIARQWGVTAEFADIVASSLGLQHFDACRATPRAYSRKPDWSKASQAVIQVPLLEPAELQVSQDERSASDAAPQSVPSNTIQAGLDRVHADAKHVHSAIDKLMNANPAQAAIDKLMNANPAQAAIDKLMNANPAQAAIDKLMNANPAQAAIDKLMNANPAQAAIDKLMNANPAQAAVDKLMKANPAQAAIDKLMNANPAQAAIDQFMKANPAQAAIDQFMKANPTQAAIDKLMKANPAQAAIDKLMKANPAQAAIDQFMNANPAQAAIDKLMKANLQVAERWSLEDGDAADEH